MNDFLNNFHELLEDTDRDKITPSTQFKNLEEWDSMIVLMLIAMFDEKYGVKINGDVISNLNTLQELYDLIN